MISEGEKIQAFLHSLLHPMIEGTRPKGLLILQFKNSRKSQESKNL